MPYGVAWHPSRRTWGRNRAPAETHAAAFARRLGPGELRYGATPELAEAAAGAAAYEAQARLLWL